MRKIDSFGADTPDSTRVLDTIGGRVIRALKVTILLEFGRKFTNSSIDPVFYMLSAFGPFTSVDSFKILNLTQKALL